MKFFRHRNLKRLIDAYGARLASDRTADVTETIRVHHAKLVLETDPETRLRSFQTLVDAGDTTALVPLMKEIVVRSDCWPGHTEPEISWLLLDRMADLYRIWLDSRTPAATP